jgi:hypothetical protein
MYYYYFDDARDRNIGYFQPCNSVGLCRQAQASEFLKFKKLVYHDCIAKNMTHEFDPITEEQNKFLISQNLLIKNRRIYASGNNWIKGQSKKFFL